MSEKLNGEIKGEEAAFERALAKSMRRVDAPESLAKFLTAAVQQETARAVPQQEQKRSRVFAFPPPRIFASRTWLGGAIAAVLVLASFGAEGFHLKRERERAAAEKEFAISSQITDRALEHAREQLQRKGILLDR